MNNGLDMATIAKDQTNVRIPKDIIDKAMVRFVKVNERVTTQQQVVIDALQFYAENFSTPESVVGNQRKAQ